MVGKRLRAGTVNEVIRAILVAVPHGVSISATKIREAGQLKLPSLTPVQVSKSLAYMIMLEEVLRTERGMYRYMGNPPPPPVPVEVQEVTATMEVTATQTITTKVTRRTNSDAIVERGEELIDELLDVSSRLQEWARAALKEVKTVRSLRQRISQVMEELGDDGE